MTTIHDTLTIRFHSGIEELLHKATTRGAAEARIPIIDLKVLVEQAEGAIGPIDSFLSDRFGGVLNKVVEITLAGRFIDEMKARVKKAEEMKPRAIKVSTTDIYMLLQLARVGEIDLSSEFTYVNLGGVEVPDAEVE